MGGNFNNFILNKNFWSFFISVSTFLFQSNNYLSVTNRISKSSKVAVLPNSSLFTVPSYSAFNYLFEFSSLIYKRYRFYYFAFQKGSIVVFSELLKYFNFKGGFPGVDVAVVKDRFWVLVQSFDPIFFVYYKFLYSRFDSFFKATGKFGSEPRFDLAVQDSFFDFRLKSKNFFIPMNYVFDSIETSLSVFFKHSSFFKFLYKSFFFKVYFSIFYVKLTYGNLFA